MAPEIAGLTEASICYSREHVRELAKQAVAITRLLTREVHVMVVAAEWCRQDPRQPETGLGNRHAECVEAAGRVHRHGLPGEDGGGCVQETLELERCRGRARRVELPQGSLPRTSKGGPLPRPSIGPERSMVIPPRSSNVTRSAGAALRVRARALQPPTCEYLRTMPRPSPS